MGSASEPTPGRGRELALAALCHLEGSEAEQRRAALTLILDEPPRGEGLGEDYFAAMAQDAPTRRFAIGLVELVIDAWAELDAKISQTSQRWRLERMDRVDRNVLRLAAAELRLRPRTPRGVILAEAVRLAARYGGDRSPTFVNGLARALADALRPEPEEAAG